jgi:AcrR family transcriptional regulator
MAVFSSGQPPGRKGSRVARPKEFDKDGALRKAIRLFSQQGFAATWTKGLMRAMGIGRQSMYDTFGDKRSLFLTALEMYVTESVHAKVKEEQVLRSSLARPVTPDPGARQDARRNHSQGNRGFEGGEPQRLRICW